MRYGKVCLFFFAAAVLLDFSAYGKLPDRFSSECLKIIYRLELELEKRMNSEYPEFGIVEEHQSYLSNLYAGGDNLRDCWVKKKWELSPSDRFPVDGRIELVIFLFDEELKKDHWVWKLPSPAKIFTVRAFPEVMNLNVGIISENKYLVKDVIRWIEKMDLR